MAALALGAVLAGCAAAEPDLPSVGDQTSGGSSAASGSLEAVAAQLHDCLRAEGIPAEYYSVDGRPVMVRFDQNVPILWQMPDGGGGFTSVVSSNEFKTWYDVGLPTVKPTGAEPLPKATPRLQVDGVDRSDVFQRCLAESGYDEELVDAELASAREPAARQLADIVVAASNRWAACARDHGFPETIDARPPTNDQEEPKALLPPTITADQLRQLLQACPNFDPEVERRQQEILLGLGDAEPDAADLADLPVQPVIGFDYPGYGVAVNVLPGEDFDPAVGTRLAQLRAILDQAALDYQAENGNG
ncbi:MAG: hypothetical protein LBK42_06475 [Propionibacteriaceae bacterium]|nr:hypothetical protein [Propionibacteriaceae bacterium]